MEKYLVECFIAIITASISSYGGCRLALARHEERIAHLKEQDTALLARLTELEKKLERLFEEFLRKSGGNRATDS